MTYPPQEPPASGDPSAYNPNQPPPGYPQAPPPGFQPGPPPGYAPQPGYQAGPPGAPQYPGGQFPPPPAGYPPAGYGYPPPQAPWPPQGPFSAGEAWSWSWAQVTKRFGTIVPPYIVWMLIIAIPQVLIQAVGTSMVAVPDSDDVLAVYTATSPVVSLFTTIVAIAVGLVAMNCLVGANLEIADGRPVGFGSFFQFRNFGQFAGAVVLTAVPGFVTQLISFGAALTGSIPLILLAGLLSLVVGIAVFVFTQFTGYFALERGLSGLAAVKAGIELVKSNVGSVLLVDLIAIGIAFAAALATGITCGLGGIIFLPFAMAVCALMHAYTYRRLTGGVIAPPPV